MSTALAIAMSETFETVESGASRSFPAQASSLRHGGFVLIQGEPYRVSSMNFSKTGKHGGMKMHIQGVHLFTGKTKDDLMMSTDTVEVPNVDRKEYQLIDIDREGFMSLFYEGKEKKDLRIQESRTEKDLRAAFAEYVRQYAFISSFEIGDIEGRFCYFTADGEMASTTSLN